MNNIECLVQFQNVDCIGTLSNTFSDFISECRQLHSIPDHIPIVLLYYDSTFSQWITLNNEYTFKRFIEIKIRVC